MAIGTTAALGIGLGASALGSFLNRRSERGAAKQQTQYGQDAWAQLRDLMQQGPSGLEQQGAGMLQEVDLQRLLGGPGGGFNTGQDALMQMLRTDPMAKSGQTLEGIIGAQGNPFDTSGLFGALGTLDRRAIDQNVAGLHASAGGLGERFGTATRGSEVELRRKALEDIGARNAGIQMASHGDAQARLMQALGMQQGGEQFGAQQQFNIANLLQQGGLAQAGLGLQAQGQQGSILGMLLQAQQARQGQNAGLAGLGLQLGRPVPVPGYGDVIGGLGAAVPGFLTNQMLLGSTPWWTQRPGGR